MVLQKGGEDYIRNASRRVPMGRYAQAVEMSYTVLFLCGPESDFITGQVISPNGRRSHCRHLTTGRRRPRRVAFCYLCASP